MEGTSTWAPRSLPLEHSKKSDVTSILFEQESGDPSASEQLLPLVYPELRRLAAAMLAQGKPGQLRKPSRLFDRLPAAIRSHLSMPQLRFGPSTNRASR